MDLTLDQLRVLDAIAAEGTFTGAGRRLHRATSAVSYAIKQLEDAIGVTLFDRSGHKASLTPAGERVLIEARAVLARVEGLHRVTRELASGFEPRVLVVIDGVLPLEPMMRALRRFTELGTPTRVELKVEFLLGVHERFVEDDGDLYLSLGVEDQTPERERERSVSWRALPALEVLLVASADHPLTSRSQRRSREELAEHVELTVADSSRAGSVRLAAIGSPSVVRLSDFHAKREALLGGVGFGWLPRHLADEPLRDKRLGVVLLDEGFRRRFTPRIGWHAARPPGRGAAQLARFITEELEARTFRGRLR
ncbi:MAG: LysR family transcriptional regulator [Myxococcales bacterium]|nr:LysR family transcriptional regulator [Myxococcales bacterium]